jgi:pilus assembly protein FimV
VIRWIQRVWPKPLDAMAELESLLFRRDGGELFELAAYRELLLLYGLARDLLDTEPGGGGAVDVLLPLNDAPGFAPTSPRPYFGDDAPPMPDGQPTAPLDLDLGPNDHRQH